LLASRNVDIRGPARQADEQEDSNGLALNDISSLENLEALARSAANRACDDFDFPPEEGSQGRDVARKRRRREVAFDRTPPNQPTSLTSASVARNFFRHLDSQHPLVLEHSSTPSFCYIASRSGPRAEGRSKRRVLESNRIVSEEYGQYELASQDAGVTPLSWKQFLKQRCLYHGAIYEGMLDD
jgi:hypothetical protein